jgi:hypothetical protein
MLLVGETKTKGSWRKPETVTVFLKQGQRVPALGVMFVVHKSQDSLDNMLI